jgi:hypothetical protein
VDACAGWQRQQFAPRDHPKNHGFTHNLDLLKRELTLEAQSRRVARHSAVGFRNL